MSFARNLLRIIGGCQSTADDGNFAKARAEFGTVASFLVILPFVGEHLAYADGVRQVNNPATGNRRVGSTALMEVLNLPFPVVQSCSTLRRGTRGFVRGLSRC